MARCGCGGNACSCKVIGGIGIEVTGNGTAASPFKITALSSSIANLIEVSSTSTVDLNLLGAGTAADPYVITADVSMLLSDLDNVSGAAPSNGQILGYNSTTQLWGPVNPPVGGGGGGGSGTVTSVNSQNPDSFGNVTITAANVGARADTWTPAWTEIRERPTTFAPSAHSHTLANISDTGTFGRQLASTATAAAARDALDAVGSTSIANFELYPTVASLPAVGVVGTIYATDDED